MPPYYVSSLQRTPHALGTNIAVLCETITDPRVPAAQAPWSVGAGTFHICHYSDVMCLYAVRIGKVWGEDLNNE